MRIYVDTGAGVAPESSGSDSLTVALGDWCYAAASSNETLDSPIIPLELKEYGSFIDEVSLCLASVLLPHRPPQFWAVAVGLLAAQHLARINTVSQRLETLQCFLEQMPDQTPVVFFVGDDGKSVCGGRPRSRAQLHSTVAQQILPSSFSDLSRFSVRTVPFPALPSTPPRRLSFSQKIRRYALQMMRVISPSSRTIWVDTIGLTSWDRIVLSVRLRVLVLPVQRIRFGTNTQSEGGNEAVSAQLQSLLTSRSAGCDSPVMKLAMQTIVPFLPAEYLEAWPQVSELLCSSVRKPQLAVFEYGWGDTTPTLAEARAAGRPLYANQHGGYYGEMGPHSAEAFERHVSRRYLTWGWEEGPMEIPLPSLRLVNFGRQYSSSRTAPLDEAVGKTVLIPLGAAGMSETGVSLFRHLVSRISEENDGDFTFIFRYHPKFRISSEAFSIEESPSVLIKWQESTDVPAATAIVQSDFVICPELGTTTFLECLAVDHPVALVAPVPSEFRGGYQAHFDLLRSASLICSSNEDVEQLRKNLRNIEGWWRAPSVVEAKTTYRDTFAVVSKDPLREWTEFLRKELRVGPDLL